MSEQIAWATTVAAVLTAVSIAAWSRARPLQSPRTPYDAYMYGQLVAGPIAIIVLLVILAGAAI